MIQVDPQNPPVLGFKHQDLPLVPWNQVGRATPSPQPRRLFTTRLSATRLFVAEAAALSEVRLAAALAILGGGTKGNTDKGDGPKTEENHGV